MFKYLCVGMGMWCLYHAWRGIVPQAGAKEEVGKPMRVSTRIIFGFGGALLTAFGLLIFRFGN